MVRKFCSALCLLLIGSALPALDLEVSSNFDNLYWGTQGRDNVEGRTFDGKQLFWNLQGSVSQQIDESLEFQGGLVIDPVLRWRAYSRLGFSLDNLSLRFAPLFGIFNSDQKWFNPGLEAQVSYTWPGVMFVSGGFLTTFAPVSRSGDYYLSSLSAAGGLMLENGIVTFHVEDKAATFRVDETLTTVDGSSKYWLDAEMFIKNFPLRWAVLPGYKITSKTYVSEVETSATVHSALLGARVSYDWGRGTSAWIQGEAALLSLGWDQTVFEVPKTAVLFQAVAGVRYHW